jgi:DNA end-binding protein Ku
MARALWKGTLGFGLVTIPVEVHKAVRDLGPHFHFLRRSDKSRIGYQTVAKADGRVVSKDELVKGYEYQKGRYVVLSPNEFEAAAVKRNSRIDLLDFVPADEVDDRYFDKPYYLLPGPGGEQAYAVLREAIKEAGLVGIAKFVMRDQPHLAAVEAIGDALVLSTLRFREELVPLRAYEFPKVRVDERDRKLAKQLIGALAGTWDPEKYTDEYRSNLMRIIEGKRKGQKPELERQEAEAGPKVVDLMERLRQSLGQAGRGRGRPTARKAERAAKKSRTRGHAPKKQTARKSRRRAA